MSFWLYRSVLAAHIIAVISWMAGILYLYRLFVYHAAETEAVVKSRFLVMEAKLYRIILMPAMGFAVLLGIAMLYLNPVLLKQPWMHGKLLLVVFLVGASVHAGRCLRAFASGGVPHSEKAFRFLNEVPTLLMVGIVLLVILRPFG